MNLKANPNLILHNLKNYKKERRKMEKMSKNQLSFRFKKVTHSAKRKK
jgi:hypothetical protein